MQDPETLSQYLWKLTHKNIKKLNHPPCFEQYLYIPKDMSVTTTQANILTNHKRNILELGCGWGEWLNQWLQHYCDDVYFAFETNWRRIHFCLKNIQKNNSIQATTNNVKIVPLNYQWFLTEIFPKHCFTIIFILFPDPWPKKRHHKKRFIQGNFDAMIVQLMKKIPSARLYIATDYGPYARKIHRYLSQSKLLQNTLPKAFLHNRPQELQHLTTQTIFEKNCLKYKRHPYWFCYTLAQSYLCP